MSILREKELIVVINSNKQNISVGEVNNKTNDYFDNELLLKQIDLNRDSKKLTKRNRNR